MFFQSMLAVGTGAFLGAIIRWLLGLSLNTLFPMLPLGTLLANLVGGYLIGAAIVFFESFSEISPLWRWLIISGFLGGLTTFSAFSAEVVILLQQQRFLWAMIAIGTHVLGSLLMTAAGMATMVWWRSI